MIGAPAITDDGMTYIWELGLDFNADPMDRDLVAMNEDGIQWEVALPDDMGALRIASVGNSQGDAPTCVLAVMR